MIIMIIYTILEKTGIEKILSKIKNNKVLNNELEISEKLKPYFVKKMMTIIYMKKNDAYEKKNFLFMNITIT